MLLSKLCVVVERKYYKIIALIKKELSCTICISAACILTIVDC